MGISWFHTSCTTRAHSLIPSTPPTQMTNLNGTLISRRFLLARISLKSGVGVVTKIVKESTRRLLSSGSRPSSTQAWPVMKDSTSNTEELALIVDTGTVAPKERSMGTFTSLEMNKTGGALTRNQSMMNGLKTEKMLKMSISISSSKTMVAPSPGFLLILMLSQCESTNNNH